MIKLPRFFRIVEEADRQGWRLSMEDNGKWILTHKVNRAIVKIVDDLHSVEEFLKGIEN